MQAERTPSWGRILAGDLVTLALVTLAGFQFHREIDAGGRMLTTFLPLVAAWLLVAPHLGAFDADRVADIGQIWRPFWAMVLAAPMAGFLRGLWLGRPVPPVFILVIGGISALAMVVWRAVHGILFVRSRT